jgi:hypothetical protein
VFDAMRTSDDLREAVVALDMMAAADLVSVRRLAAYVEGRAGWRGVPLVRRALGLSSEDSRSPGETRTRLVWLLDARLPAPLVNRSVYDLGGRLLGIAALLDPHAGLVVEYDGADHRTAARHSADVAREDRLRRHGPEVVRVTGPDLAHPARPAARLLAARSRARWDPPGARAWTATAPWGRLAPSLDEELDRRDVLHELHELTSRSAPHPGP